MSHADHADRRTAAWRADEPAAPPPSNTKSSPRCSTWAARSRRFSISTICCSKIPRLIARLITFDAFAVYLLDERRGELKVAYSVGYPDRDEPLRLKLGQGLVGAAVASEQPLLVNDVASDPRYVEFVPGMASEIVVPLVHKSKPIGALNILSRQSRSLHAATTWRSCASSPRTSPSRSSTRGSSNGAASTPKRSRRSRRSDAKSRRCSISTSCLRASRSSTRRLIDYRTFGILLLNDDNELEIKLAVQFGEKRDVPRVRLGEGHRRLRRAASRAGARVRRLAGSALHPRRARRPLRAGDPDALKDRCIGVVDLESPELDAFTKRDVEILTLLASQAAVAIENARLYEEVRANEERLEKEVRFAQRVQIALLPTGPPKRLKGVEVAAAFDPAREVGGDFHDYLAPESNTLVVAVGDVSGKGVPAALYSAFAAELVRGRTFRRRYLPERSSPASVLASINTILHQRQLEEYYCTLCYTIFDLKRRTMTLANSGLPYPIRCSATSCAQIELARRAARIVRGLDVRRGRHSRCSRARSTCSARTGCSRR